MSIYIDTGGINEQLVNVYPSSSRPSALQIGAYTATYINAEQI